MNSYDSPEDFYGLELSLLKASALRTFSQNEGGFLAVSSQPVLLFSNHVLGAHDPGVPWAVPQKLKGKFAMLPKDKVKTSESELADK